MTGIVFAGEMNRPPVHRRPGKGADVMYVGL
jgi:hypothetical protein